MTTPYFVPSDDLLHAICTAAQRGGECQYYPARKMIHCARRLGQSRLFSELLAAGVKIYQFGRAVTYQSVLVDGELRHRMVP